MPRTEGSIARPGACAPAEPFALSGAGALAKLLAAAGLDPQETHDVVCHFDYASDDEALRAMMSAGPCVRAARHAGEEATSKALLESVAPYRQPDGSYRIANAFRFTLATLPA